MKRMDRGLTAGEIRLAQSIFGDAVDYEKVRICHHKWIFFQPAHVVMAPMGAMYFHPKGGIYCGDFSQASHALQGLFIHEMVHIWQAQTKGRWYLVLMRHPFARYHYSLKPGWRLERYGLEQQAEIVRHYWMLKQGYIIAGAPSVESYAKILPFRPMAAANPP